MTTSRRLVSGVTEPTLFTLFALFAILSMTLLPGCATQQGSQGASLGALTGSAAGALIDSGNPWRGALIGGGLGATLGGGLTDRPYYSDPYRRGYAYQPRGYYHSPPPRNYTGRGVAFGGLTGAAAGALIDNGNPWRGGVLGGFLGSIFGGGIGAIHSGVRVPVLRP